MALSGVALSCANAAEPSNTLVDSWKISGDIRAGYVKYDYGNPPSHIDPSNGKVIAKNPNINQGHADSNGFYIIPKISLESIRYEGFKVKATVAAATDFGLNNELYEQRNFIFDPVERKSFMAIQEAYVDYKSKDNVHEVLVGANEIDTPMISDDDWYMLADSYQLAIYKNRSLSNITMGAAYFYKMIGVWDSGANGTEWHTMSDASFVDGGYKEKGGDKGVLTLFFTYDKDSHHFQAWNYYMNEYYNTFFAQYDFKNQFDGVKYDFGLQLIDFYGVGGLKDYYANTLGGRSIDYSIYSIKLDSSFSNGIDVALGASFYTDGDGVGDTLGAWGAYPYFANGMIFHFFEAGSLRNTNSYKAQLGYR